MRVIGIGGVSRSGKTTISGKIAYALRLKNYQVYHLRQDNFVKNILDIPSIKSEPDWEHPASIDSSLMLKYIQFLRESFEFVLVDGLFAFNFPALNDCYDKKIYIHLSKEEFLRRKALDTRWGYVEPWFIEHIWNSHQKCCVVSPEDEDYLHVNGEEDYDIVSILKHIIHGN